MSGKGRLSFILMIKFKSNVRGQLLAFITLVRSLLGTKLNRFMENATMKSLGTNLKFKVQK